MQNPSDRFLSMQPTNSINQKEKLTVRCSCRPWLRCYTSQFFALALLCLVVVVVVPQINCVGSTCRFRLCLSNVIPPGVSCFSVLQLPGFSFGTRQQSEIQSSPPSPAQPAPASASRFIHFVSVRAKRPEERRRIISAGRLNCCAVAISITGILPAAC